MELSFLQLFLGLIVVLSSLGVILAKKPVHSCLFFLLTLVALAGIYMGLWAPFISVMQVLIYAGAILVIFMFVIVLFQDAYLAIGEYESRCSRLWLITAATTFVATVLFLGIELAKAPFAQKELPAGYGSVETLGRALYVDFFFPFEAVALLFLVAIIGALYIGKKV